MDASGAQALALNKFIEQCLELIRMNATSFKSHTLVPLHSEMDKRILKDGKKSLEERGYSVEEVGYYLRIKW